MCYTGQANHGETKFGQSENHEWYRSATHKIWPYEVGVIWDKIITGKANSHYAKNICYTGPGHTKPDHTKHGYMGQDKHEER